MDYDPTSMESASTPGAEERVAWACLMLRDALAELGADRFREAYIAAGGVGFPLAVVRRVPASPPIVLEDELYECWGLPDRPPAFRDALLQLARAAGRCPTMPA
jgi:hypothetical protein